MIKLYFKKLTQLKKFIKVELYQVVLKYLIRNLFISIFIRQLALITLWNLMKVNAQYVKLKNRCLINNKSRFLFKLFNLSRMSFKLFISKNYLPGLRKVTW